MKFAPQVRTQSWVPAHTQPPPRRAERTHPQMSATKDQRPLTQPLNLYSYRNAAMGLILVARRAGIRIARNAVALRTTAAPPIAIGSVGRTANNIPAI